MNAISRRALIVGAAVATVVAPSAALATQGADAALFQAFNDWAAAYRDLGEIGDDDDAYRRIDNAEDRLMAIVPQTVEGMKAKARWVWAHIDGSTQAADQATRGEAVQPPSDSDRWLQALWGLAHGMPVRPVPFWGSPGQGAAIMTTPPSHRRAGPEERQPLGGPIHTVDPGPPGVSEAV
ncbi:hypothetical protein [Nitrospirillum viridazoti]|uniref:Uncharacterized protein n=1 Tax=Nitrospirillum amazonense TaxID=28077 RepID=A0A560ITC6_9PROT|nr:hypothetical protein [Nitrospirillum amazonense]TWB62246.1 hypothetical protein FBZ92_105181 [Nitrospirillum amazonense]